MARRYNRDSRGRFASGGGGGGSKRPAARGISRGTNRLTRDNSGRITSVGGDGATARGGRLRTASGKQRGRVTANIGAADRMSSTPKGTIGKTRKQREITMIDRPQAKRAAYNAGRAQQQAAIASRKAKPATVTAAPSKLGARLNPAKKADRRAKRNFDKAYNRENRIRSALFSGNKTQSQKDAIGKSLNNASRMTATMLQIRRGIRAQFPVQSKDKLTKLSRRSASGTISKNKNTRNAVNRRAAFVRKVNRAGALPSNNSGKKGRQTARTRAKALATYQGARRPEISDSTVGVLSSARKSPAFRPISSRLAAPSKGAQRAGRALANRAAGIARDKFGRRAMNPAKGNKKARTAAKALEFYRNPKAAAEMVLKNQGKAGKRTRGFRLPRSQRR